MYIYSVCMIYVYICNCAYILIYIYIHTYIYVYGHFWPQGCNINISESCYFSLPTTRQLHPQLTERRQKSRFQSTKISLQIQPRLYARTGRIALSSEILIHISTPYEKPPITFDETTLNPMTKSFCLRIYGIVYLYIRILVGG